MPLRRLDRFDDDLLTILKYPGKTNELFTKLLLNVALASSALAGDCRRPTTRRLVVLDPLCGRGTTLNQALMYGFDAYGMDIDARDFEAYSVFIKRWLKDKRLKHRAESSTVRRDRKVVAQDACRRSSPATKDEYKAGDIQRLEVVEADTTRVGEFFGPGRPTWWSPTCRTASSTAATARRAPAASGPGTAPRPSPGARSTCCARRPRPG